MFKNHFQRRAALLMGGCTSGAMLMRSPIAFAQRSSSQVAKKRPNEIIGNKDA
jgi:hypothetical protein